MKKLIAASILLLTGVALFFYLLNYHPIILKTFAGTARVLAPPLDASIKVEGQEVPGGRCFAMRSYFDGTPADSLVLWIPEPSAYSGRAIFLVDRKRPYVGQPNSSASDYYLLWDRLLFQSESGSINSAFNKGGDYEDPQLVVTKDVVKFRVHSAVSEFPGKHIEVNLK